MDVTFVNLDKGLLQRKFKGNFQDLRHFGAVKTNIKLSTTHKLSNKFPIFTEKEPFGNECLIVYEQKLHWDLGPNIVCRGATGDWDFRISDLVKNPDVTAI